MIDTSPAAHPRAGRQTHERLWETPAHWQTQHVTPTQIILPNLAGTARLAVRAAGLAHPGDVILLAGPLGAGKTAFARAFLRAATGDQQLEVPSPSFTLLQSYETTIGTVHHFDLWRLDGPRALAELGWDDARADIVLVEWPDRLEHARPDDALIITFALSDGETRRATLAGWPDRIDRLL
jgi:tRNA threonylcarbamoyladenosine biosynthesis protein TsaE